MTLDEADDVFKGWNPVAIVMGAALRSYLAHTLTGEERSDLGKCEILDEPTLHISTVQVFGDQSFAKFRSFGYICGRFDDCAPPVGGQYRFVSRDQHAVFGRH